MGGLQARDPKVEGNVKNRAAGVRYIPFHERDADWLREHCGRPLAEPLKAMVVSYLKRGKTLSARPQIARDQLVDEKPVIGPVKTLTDGTWAWLNVLAYYVQEHDLTLPEDFLEHGEAVKWTLSRKRVDTVPLKPEP